jgi:hypothetical protein
MHGEKRNAYRILVGKPERKKPLGRPRRSCENTCNMKMDLREIGWSVWTVPCNVGYFLNTSVTSCFDR